MPDSQTPILVKTKNWLAETSAAPPSLYGVCLFLRKVLPMITETAKDKYTVIIDIGL